MKPLDDRREEEERRASGVSPNIPVKNSEDSNSRPNGTRGEKVSRWKRRENEGAAQQQPAEDATEAARAPRDDSARG